MEAKVSRKIKKHEGKMETNAPVSLLDMSVREWFAINHPDEMEFLEDLVSETTFRDALLALLHGEKFYEVIGISDTVDREFVFYELAKILRVRYSDIYNLWLDYAISESLRKAVGGII